MASTPSAAGASSASTNPSSSKIKSSQQQQANTSGVKREDNQKIATSSNQILESVNAVGGQELNVEKSQKPREERKLTYAQKTRFGNAVFQAPAPPKHLVPQQPSPTQLPATSPTTAKPVLEFPRKTHLLKQNSNLSGYEEDSTTSNAETAKNKRKHKKRRKKNKAHHHEETTQGNGTTTATTSTSSPQNSTDEHQKQQQQQLDEEAIKKIVKDFKLQAFQQIEQLAANMENQLLERLKKQ